VSHDLGRSINDWVEPRDFDVIPNVVDTSLFKLSDHLPVAPFRFIHVSTLDAVQKRPADLIKAFLNVAKDLKDVELIIVGPDNYGLRQLAIENGVAHPRIFFRGEVTYSRVAGELRQSHAFVLNSVYENQPCAVLEALCCGLPVAASNVGG